jgi:hypothetical protein
VNRRANDVIDRRMTLRELVEEARWSVKDACEIRAFGLFLEAPRPVTDPDLCAYALGEIGGRELLERLAPDELAEVEA